MKKKVGEETNWTLYADEGSGLGWHELVLSRSIPSGNYRLEYGEELPAGAVGKGATKGETKGATKGASKEASKEASTKENVRRRGGWYR